MGYGLIGFSYEYFLQMVRGKPELGIQDAKLEFCQACNPDLPERVRKLVDLPAEFEVIDSHFAYWRRSIELTVKHPIIPDIEPGEELPIITPILYQYIDPVTHSRRIVVTRIIIRHRQMVDLFIDLVNPNDLAKPQTLQDYIDAGTVEEAESKS